jgi:hypothetical protein
MFNSIKLNQMMRSILKSLKVTLTFSCCLLFFSGSKVVSKNENAVKNEDFADMQKINPNFVFCQELKSERLDTVARTIFWRKLMNTSKDTFVFYTSPEKSVLCAIPASTYNLFSDLQKDKFKDSLRAINGLVDDKRIMYAMGRNHFYNVSSVISDIEKSNVIFKKQGVDPFYAQAILLIESPGKLAKSTVGAYGPFQLMKSVGLKYGLKINNTVDERGNLEKSAVAACKLISSICIPYTNKILEKYNIAWCETDLWYRLLVLHVYHAGAGNVAKALQVMQPEVGNMALIMQLWNTSAGGFQNCSQNYSQVAIASLFELEHYLYKIQTQELAEN